ncbi:MAG: DUF3110 domain-containing protein [Leptolyngbyaceae cyanobacterium MO_188.B28]|nr:DUF3110 domain-containing protein [Leptolyngbyaceae cyanobacterium MO_188.B28]
MQVFVLLFNARTDNEGIHTLKVGDRNIVLMFENEDDATRFGLMLEAQDFPNSSVEVFDSEEIEEFCQGAGYECKQVPEGTLAVPPETNLEKTDWDPDTKPDETAKASADPKPDATLSEDELNRIRRQLEGLL